MIGLIAVGLFFLSDFDGHLINRNDMPVEFYVGGLAAVYKWNTQSLDKLAHFSLIVLIGASVIVTLFGFTEGEITWLRLMAPLLIWTAASRLVDTPFGNWCAALSKYSFFIFVCHAALMRISWIIFQKALPSVPVQVFTTIAPFAIVASCIGLFKILNGLMPRQLDWALGSRGEKNRSKTRLSSVDEVESTPVR